MASVPMVVTPSTGYRVVAERLVENTDVLQPDFPARDDVL